MAVGASILFFTGIDTRPREFSSFSYIKNEFRTLAYSKMFFGEKRKTNFLTKVNSTTFMPEDLYVKA